MASVTIEQLGILVGVLTGLLSLASVVYLAGVKMSALQASIACLLGLDVTTAELRVKVDTLWDFLMRRAKAEAVQVGWGAMGSPIHLTTAGFEMIRPFLNKFLPVYAELVARNASEQEVWMTLENRFGDEIIEQICIPGKVSAGACMIAIIESCKLARREA